MTNNVKKDKVPSKEELELIRKELDTFKQNSAIAPMFVLSDSGKFIKILKTGKTYRVNLEAALEALLPDIIDYGNIDPLEMRQEFEGLLDEATEFMLEHIGVEQYKHYRNLIRASGYFFAELLQREEKRPIT